MYTPSVRVCVCMWLWVSARRKPCLVLKGLLRWWPREGVVQEFILLQTIWNVRLGFSHIYIYINIYISCRLFLFHFSFKEMKYFYKVWLLEVCFLTYEFTNTIITFYFVVCFQKHNSNAFWPFQLTVSCSLPGLGVCWQRTEDHEGKRKQSKQHPADSDSPDLPNGLVSDHKEPQSKSS